jgi:hypothetical protein
VTTAYGRFFHRKQREVFPQMANQNNKLACHFLLPKRAKEVVDQKSIVSLV